MGWWLRTQTRYELLLQMVPRYREAPAAHKGALLDEAAAQTGYTRGYAMWLLNHPELMQPHTRRKRQPQYGPEVQHALFLAWQAANRICSKRLIPFLPTLIDALERHEHLHLTDACRSQLLSISAATADRLLTTQRTQYLHGISTTTAGTYLKHQIPLRTFQAWNSTHPGFLEADLVAHCGAQAEGSFLYMLTLTDIATGWTECLPLRSKCAQDVLSAIQQVRARLPFPLLGLDTDNGSEFLNQTLLRYCEAEQITFTRGRPDLKNDQCHVEQKNRVIVRQVIGYARLEGTWAYYQLAQVYLALRLYVNGFQPSMQLQAMSTDGRTPRRIYDAAKTPLQRLLLSQVLLASTEQESQRAARLLDPLRLLHHLYELQQALLRPLPPFLFDASETAPEAILLFRLERCVAGPRSALPGIPEALHQTLYPCRDDGSLFVLLSALVEEEAPTEVSSQPEVMRHLSTTSAGVVSNEQEPSEGPPLVSHKQARSPSTKWTIEHALQEYLHEQQHKHRRPKTLEWHRKALGLLQHYLLTEHHCTGLDQITPAHLTGWLAWLPQAPGAAGRPRSANTVHSYARSARAFCQWAVRHTSLSITPFAHLPLPSGEVPQLPVLEVEEWERLLVACRSSRESEGQPVQATVRNQAILWVLFETGMRASEVCALRLCDVDRAQHQQLVLGKDTQRRLTLGHKGWHHLLTYLDDYRLRTTTGAEAVEERSEHLFLSETGRPLTKSGIALFFGRLRKRASIAGKQITAFLLRQNFAARYLQAGGDLGTLWEVLGQRESASFQHALGLETKEGNSIEQGRDG